MKRKTPLQIERLKHAETKRLLAEAEGAIVALRTQLAEAARDERNERMQRAAYYEVEVTLGDGRTTTLQSLPCSVAQARHEVADLKMTGHKATVHLLRRSTAREATDHDFTT